MGITGLLPLLKSIHKNCHIRNFEGKTLGVDAYGWLHRGAVSCALELATGKPTRKFVEFAMFRVRMLQHFGVVPYLVFDGDYLPSKAVTEIRRTKRREESKKIGLDMLNAGKLSQAHAEFQKSFDVTPEMARQLIDELRTSGIKYIVAPYEADSQMVYLESKGIISGIISEDSDLLVFGAKCLLTKLDQYGNCVEVNKSNFSACRDINLTGWSDAAFRQMAILSGCDYLDSVNNMGLKTAYRLIRKYKSIEKVVQMLQFDGKFHVPKGYLESFYKAELTFLHQRVFCPQSLELVLCTQPTKPINLDDMPYIGAFVEPKIAYGVAKGDLHPMTKLPLITSISAETSHQIKRWVTSPSKRQGPGTIKGMPINKYFKKRMPLAEIDPNTFTLSPDKQRILDRNFESQISNSIHQLDQWPQRRIHRSSFPISEQDRRDQHTNISLTTSGLRSPKRARLCADMDILSTGSVPFHSSPYFCSRSDRSSLTSDIRSGDDKKKDLNHQSHCDNVIKETSSNPPKISDCTKADEIVRAVFVDEKQTVKVKESATNVNRQETIITGVSSKTRKPFVQSKSKNDLIESHSFGKVVYAPQIRHDLQLSKRLTPITPDQALHEDFTPLFTLGCKQSRIPCATRSIIPSSNSFEKRNLSTPLQRISILAIKQTKIPESNSHKVQHLACKGKSQISNIEDSKRVTKELPETLTFHLPTLDDMKDVYLSTTTGSEDLIFVDSEDEISSMINT